MTLQNLRNQFRKTLAGTYPEEEIDTFFYALTQAWLSVSRLDIAMNPQKPVPEEKAGVFSDALLRLGQQEPIQYILGETEFYGRTFWVSAETLIPRPETEELIDWILQDYKSVATQGFSILDCGTGSGCIAVTLAAELGIDNAVAIDNSEAALELAGRNAKRHGISLKMLHDDLLKMKQLDSTFDVIVSNPPYVRESEKRAMRENVLGYEPGQALFVPDDDPLIFYRVIGQMAQQHLKKNGVLYFEINEYLSDELTRLLSGLGFTVKVRKDLFGKDRMAKCMGNERNS